MVFLTDNITINAKTVLCNLKHCRERCELFMPKYTLSEYKKINLGGGRNILWW